MLTTYADWREETVVSEMAARRSFSHTMQKFQDRIEKAKPLAILTAFRGDLRNDLGQLLTPNALLAKNRFANQRLEKELTRRQLSFYPVVGAGQEEDKGTGQIKVTKEESFLVQPIQEMSNEEFLKNIKELLFNAKNLDHQQWGAAVKLPGEQPFLLHHHGNPTTPADYTQKMTMGNAKPRMDDPYYTQLTKGPRSKDNPDSGRQFALGG